MPSATFGYSQSDWDATKQMATDFLQRRASLLDPTVAYSALGPSLRPIPFQPDSPAFHEMLGEISTAEDGAGRGMLSVLVVHKDGDLRPGPGFFELAAARGRDISDRDRCWLAEFNAVVAYWTSHAP